MKKYLNLAIFAVCISLPVSANTAKNVTTTTHSNTAQMMDHQAMMHPQGHMAMQTKMQEMSALMQQIVHEDSQEKREVLMAEHMQKMQEHINMMNTSEQQGSMPDKIKNEQMVPMGQRMELMEGRMNMMRDLMNQMMEHSAQRELRPKQAHRVVD
ncbi:hypothetical protein [Flavobacterium sp. W21_SRS_FM6]|uniref:hypothetical protein n=1 Tax=Flavobacterium sp. W21_SRS_FM6 TaxID=3240268 RepID=UPI003F8DDDB4